jgi:4-diphosphocytidyl-2-C-methyl-D-erythritol kinase
MEDAPLAVFAPAKVNLYLHVTGRRDDGYHELESLVAFADVGDCVTAEAASDLSLRVTGPQAAGLSAGDDNLVMRAADALCARTGVPAGAALTLEKVLPVASGIGGGSADAAAALKVLVRLWGLHPGAHDLSGLALDLGADVPVCLAGRAAVMSGIGERLDFVEMPAPLAAVLVNPGVAVPTPAVFKARQGPFSEPMAHPLPADPDAMLGYLEARRNDLETPALQLAPVIGEVLEALRATQGCGLARMSGSGATCFGLFADRAAAEAAAAALSGARPDWWITSTMLGGTGMLGGL